MSEKNENKKKPSFDFDKLQDFLLENPSLAKSGASKGVFSLGVLVQLVFALQQYNLQSTPFKEKLKGLNMTPKDIERIFREAVEKIKQYEEPPGDYYKKLREYLAEYLLLYRAQINKMSNQEISFNFVCGLELGRKFKS